MGGKRYTYKIFCNSFDDVDLFACICLSACLPEYLLFLISFFPLTRVEVSKNIPLHFIPSLIID
jgi:hypothetical protein